jgi:hypothetical protein
MSKFRKIVKIISRSQLSIFDNMEFKVLLECGHKTSATYHYGEKVLGRKKLCYECD